MLLYKKEDDSLNYNKNNNNNINDNDNNENNIDNNYNIKAIIIIIFAHLESLILKEFTVLYKDKHSAVTKWPGEEVPGSIPAVAARSLLVGSVLV